MVSKTKICAGECGLVKPDDCFYLVRGKLSSYCKKCSLSYKRKYYIPRQTINTNIIDQQCCNCHFIKSRIYFLENKKFSSKLDPICIDCRIKNKISLIVFSKGNICSKCNIEQSVDKFFKIFQNNGVSYHCNACEAIIKIIKKINKTKECQHCHKQVNNFDIDLTQHDYIKNICIKCESTNKKNNIPQIKRCNECNCIKTIDLFKSKYSNCKECIAKFRSSNQYLARERDRYFKNKDHILQRQKIRYNINKKKDGSFLVRKSISSSVNRYLRNNGSCKNNNSILKYLPYSIEQLKRHIESKWDSWMNWSNWGKFDANRDTWQIDHIVPHSFFRYNSMKDEAFQKCWSLDNLRPLRAKDNLLKSNKLNYKV